MTQIFLEILSNLVINKSGNPDDQWLPYKPVDPNKLYKTLDGSWYQKMVVTSITDTGKQLAVPIGLYIDASETVTYQQYSFQPLLMLPLLLNIKACSQKNCI
jgi:hypothetical protein